MSMPPTGFAKAYLLVEGGDRLTCWFNPTSLHTTRTAAWEAQKTPSQAAPDLSYLGTDDGELTVDILLHADGEAAGRDVRAATDDLLALLDPTVALTGRAQRRPPTVQFVWGAFSSFVAVCHSVDVTTALFDADGTPLRAVVKLSLRQFAAEIGHGPAPPQNPTTRATATRRSHTVVPGDSLQSIAYAQLGDPQRWREVAELNRIDDPTRLRPGQQLIVLAGDA
jgi:nucleoid-associated protein YgaU